MKTLIITVLVIASTSLQALDKADPEFKTSHMNEQAFWYSLYNLDALALRSGLGETFTLNGELIAKMVEMASDNYSTAIVPSNLALLKRIYNSGNPKYTGQRKRWARASNAPTSGATFGWALMNEVEWSKQFNIDNQVGDPGHNNIPGAQERFMGMVLCAKALKQAQDFKGNPNRYFNDNRSDEYIAMAAISNLAQFIGTSSNSKMRENRCAKVASIMMGKPASEVSKDLLNQARKIYQNMAKPVIPRDFSLAILGLTWYGYANVANRSAIRAKIKEFGDELYAWTSQSILNQAYKIRAFLDVYRITGEIDYRDGAVAYFLFMMDDYLGGMGVFIDKMKFTPNEMAILLGAFNSIKLFAISDIDANKFDSNMKKFFLTVVNKSRLQMTAPAISHIPEYLRKTDDMFHRYPYTPVPGNLKIAPVFAKKVSLIKNKWVVDKAFDTAGAMHLSNEMIWLNRKNGFPKW